MEWKTLFTIYLAVGAPFAAARWLPADSVETRGRRIVGTLLTLVAWPYIGLRAAERLGVLSSGTIPHEADPKN